MLQQLTTITEACRSRLEAIETAQSASSKQFPLVGLVGAPDVGETWESLSLTRKRAVIDALMTIQIRKTDRRGPGFDPDSVVIEWR
jgi:hypothetical protein